jgi:formylglycine-generating enzyme required for sulfatase activity
VEFCERLSRATGRRYRLPTEAEWEYACRAGAQWPFHFGQAIIPEWANYHGRYPYAAAPKSAHRQQTIPVGSLGIANAFGLYDMHGNVWEWCLDSWHDNYFSSPEDGSSWEEGGVGYLKALRGGAWDSSAGECRVSSRNRITSSLRLNNVGFRVVAEEMSNEKAADLSRVDN